MKTWIKFSLVAVAALAISPANAQQKNSQNPVIAQVGNRSITLSDFNTKYNDVVNRTMNPPNKKQFLEDLIRFEIGVQEAEKANLKKDPIVQERINQEIYKALLEKRLAAQIQRIRVTDKQMQAYYRNNPEIRTSHIFVSVPPGAKAEERAAAKKRADEIYKSVANSKRDFAELVKLYSDDSVTKANGGDLGWITSLTFVPEYYNAIKNLAPGRTSNVIETPQGFHIIRVTGKRSYKDADLAQVRVAVFEMEKKKIFDAYFAQLKKNYPVKINPSVTL